MSDRKPPRPDDQRIPPPQMTPAPYTADRQVEPTTNPGLKLTPEQTESLRQYAPAEVPKYVASDEYVKSKVAAVAKRLDDESSYIDAVMSKVKALGALLVASVGVTASVLVGLDVRAQSKVDAGAAPLIEAQAKLDARVGKLENGQQRAELTSMRQTVMLEQLTEKARLPVPPLVVMLDGGR